ncbi:MULTISPECIES: MFS transporter [Aureimonas]|uniref:MFS transporter n=1 Tax=Aureimonas TaxID=414371 RepID=UPI0009E73AF0
MGLASGRVVRPRWQVIPALGVFEILAWGSSYYLPAVLALPIATDTGWPLPWIIGGLTVGLLVSAAASPWIGATIGRAGGRAVLASGAVLLASGLAVLGSAANLPTFLAGWLAMGLGMGMGLYDPAFATLGRLYGSDARSAITTLTLWGGFASTVCWPLSALLVDHLGWRATCLVYAALHLLVSLPLALRFIPRVPPSTVTRSGPGSDGLGVPTGDRTFLVLAALLVVSGAIMGLVSVHLLTLLQARGETLAAAVTLGAMVGPAQVGARLLEMAGRERHHPLWTLRAAVVLIAVGLCLLAFETSAVAVAVVLYGAGNGILSIARGTVPLALFGPEAYPTMMGRLARPAQMAQAIAPTAGAAMISYAGPSATLGLLAVLACVGVVLVASLTIAASRMPSR